MQGIVYRYLTNLSLVIWRLAMTTDVIADADKKYITMQQAMELLGVSRMTIYRILEDPNTEMVGVKIGSSRRVSLPSVYAYMRALERVAGGDSNA